ncbi:MAG: DNA mismatch repair protein MutS [Spirochaetia bacterium]|nr:DNA mismatch repair protein MutS [Spirochaetia bacterium]
MSQPSLTDPELKEALDTPVMRQFLDLKRSYPDSILFFRMGDFYEMFLEDAKTAAPILDLALTRRQNAIPMAGVPYHSMDGYLARLIAAGLRVAIAEQAIDEANPKLMRRLVTRVVSPGTVIEDSLLPESAHSYLIAVIPESKASDKPRVGVALADVATGDFRAFDLAADELSNFLFKNAPVETLTVADFRNILKQPGLPQPMLLEDWKAEPQEGLRQIEQRFSMKARTLGFPEDSLAPGACGLVIHYLAQSFPTGPFPLPAPVFGGRSDSVLSLDEETIRNLELVQSARGGEERTLLSVLNRCQTAAGRRLMRECVLEPLNNLKEIETRQASVEELAKSMGRSNVQKELLAVRDLERILTRLARGGGGPQDFNAVRSTISAYYSVKQHVPDNAFHCFVRTKPEISALESLKELQQTLNDVVLEEPPPVLGSADFIRRGIRPELDEARSAREEGAGWILAYEEEEKTKAGIPLKIRYNRVHGYYIEVTKSYVASVPGHFKRRQTLLGAERYSTDRLAVLEEKIQGAESVIERAEKEEFERLSELVVSNADKLKNLMLALASLDVALALAHVAERFSWTRPQLARPEKPESRELVIEEGRHPVVEAYLEMGEHFVPNGLKLGALRSLAILTGPNMAGKSTFIRQTALIQLLAQIGSFVPAKKAILPLCDGIFTRIGAADNLSRGESTFYVEMLETARILRRATGRSLVILDEVGRGTSTYDGLSIAWAIVEALSSGKGPLVLFATHYHELTGLDSREGVFNLTMEVREIDGQIHFLRKVRDGAADRSYGIHVAELAGIPDSVLRRAREKLSELEASGGKKARSLRFREKATQEPSLFSDTES